MLHHKKQSHIRVSKISVFFQDSLFTGVIKLGSKYLSLNFQDCTDSSHVITNIQGWVKESRIGSNSRVFFLFLKKKKKGKKEENKEKSYGRFFHKFNYRKRLFFFLKKETFHWKVVTIHVSYWIFGNGRCLCLDPKEIPSNAERSWSSTRSMMDIFIDHNNTLIQFIFLLLQPKAAAHFIDIRIGIITEKNPYGYIFGLFCFLKCKPSKIRGGGNKTNTFSEKQSKYFPVTFINACLCELYLYWQSKLDHKIA